MTRAPQPPREQRSFADHGVQSGQPGDADVNTGQQGRYGNLKQNMTPQRQTHGR